MDKQITVSIVYDSKGTKCEGSCGLDWTSSEIVGILRKRLYERFGRTITLELIDLSSNVEQIKILKDRIHLDNLLIPLLLVNNEVRISGEFDIRQLMDAVEVEKEISVSHPSRIG